MRSTTKRKVIQSATLMQYRIRNNAVVSKPHNISRTFPFDQADVIQTKLLNGVYVRFLDDQLQVVIKQNEMYS